MKIVIACGAMPFGPATPYVRSLGGSETAALMFATAIAGRGHEVTMFCNLPPKGAPDFFPSGEKHGSGVRFVDLSNYATLVSVNQYDLLIAVRDPALAVVPGLFKKKVLWMHDIATVRGYKRAFEQMQFAFDQIWTVSEWHRYQVSETTGYPLERIVGLRNGIVRHEPTFGGPRVSKQLIYAARPERGLWNLVRPGGIMERLPDYKLLIAMYEHFPENMREFYAQVFEAVKRLPNAEIIGGKSNLELRQIIRDSEAYIYPTQFEETSCILARECIEQGTPFVATAVGALMETMGDCGIFFEEWLHEHGISEPERGSDEWCEFFALYFRDVLEDKEALAEYAARCAARTDLYWEGVAEMAEPLFETNEVATPFSRLWSLIQDGDIIPAKAYLAHVMAEMSPQDDLTAPMRAMFEELHWNYAFTEGDMQAYYERTYREKGETAQTELYFLTETQGIRYRAIADQVAQMPRDSVVFEYGCGPGHVLGPLAKEFPHIKFVGYDFSQSAVEVVNKGAAEHGLKNLAAISGTVNDGSQPFADMVICSEVLEHVVEPWKLAQTVEGFCKKGGRVVFTTPFGAWEPINFNQTGRWNERYHLWHIDRDMMIDMLGEKQGVRTSLVVSGTDDFARPIGNTLFTYIADHAPTRKVDALAKAMRHFPRQTSAAAVIAYNNEDTILRMLNSLSGRVQFVQIAMGPCSDLTKQLVLSWFSQRPYIRHRIIDVPKIEPRKFGFDDARNASTQDLARDFEWALWIDTDERLSGSFSKYLRNSSIEAYIIAQHHFTVEPRGVPAEIDRPARLIRLSAGYAAKGHIHEHFEVPAGGPGRAFILPDVDIGHDGYQNEAVRRERFFRNFPFLEWEHEEGGDRKLHKFLWLRDIIHRMRMVQDAEARRKLAEEAISYYNEHQSDMAAFGPGIVMSLAYLAEANAALGRGVPIEITIKLDDRAATLKSLFTDYEQIEKIVGQMLRDEFKERQSRYY